VDINATLIGQMITFALFVWFTMHFVWPVLEKILRERQDKIAEGLAAGERGRKELEVSQKYAVQHLLEARHKGLEEIEKAKKQAILIVQEAKAEANREKELIIAQGYAEIERQRLTTKEQLQKDIVDLVIDTAEKLLNRSMTETDHKILLEIGGLQVRDQ
jgi:F-type H+-transporting ATPase subunit b